MVNVNYIRYLIEKHGYTLGQLEVKTGISKAHWSRILACKRGVGTKTVAAIMRVFSEADVSQIFLSDLFPNGNSQKGGEQNE